MLIYSTYYSLRILYIRLQSNISSAAFFITFLLVEFSSNLFNVKSQHVHSIIEARILHSYLLCSQKIDFLSFLLMLKLLFPVNVLFFERFFNLHGKCKLKLSINKVQGNIFLASYFLRLP